MNKVVIEEWFYGEGAHNKAGAPAIGDRELTLSGPSKAHDRNAHIATALGRPALEG